MTPSAAYTALSLQFGKDYNWMVELVGRASISDGYKPKQARREVYKLMRNFSERGMSEIARTVFDTLAKDREWQQLLATIQRHGASEVVRAEQRRVTETFRAANKHAAGMLPPTMAR